MINHKEKEDTYIMDRLHEKTDQVTRLTEDTPDGMIHDADTILKDLLDQADCEVSGLAKELIGIWRDSTDKPRIEQLFCLFTGCEFGDWLDQCIAGTTRRENTCD